MIQTIRAIRLVCYPNYSNTKINIRFSSSLRLYLMHWPAACLSLTTDRLINTMLIHTKSLILAPKIILQSVLRLPRLTRLSASHVDLPYNVFP